MKRKYNCYTVSTEFGEEVFFDYKTAFSYYSKYKTATLWGVDNQGDCCVILSK